MTFRGNLLLYTLWYELHPFENLRRSICHGLTHLSGRTQNFYRVWVKILWAVHLPRQSVRQVVAVSAPATGTHTGVAPAGNEQGPAATTESVRETARSYIPAAFCRDGAQATARRGGATGTVAASPGFSRIGP